MSRKKSSKNRARRSRGRRAEASLPAAAPQGPDTVTQLLYGLLALFWLYAGISATIQTTAMMENRPENGILELPWLVPAAVALFAVGWFWFYYVHVVAASGRPKLAQGLLIGFFLVFLASIVPVFLGETELVRNGARTYFSFGLMGLFLRMSTQRRQRAGFLGALFSQRDDS